MSPWRSVVVLCTCEFTPFFFFNVNCHYELFMKGTFKGEAWVKEEVLYLGFIVVLISFHVCVAFLYIRNLTL